MIGILKITQKSLNAPLLQPAIFEVELSDPKMKLAPIKYSPIIEKRASKISIPARMLKLPAQSLQHPRILSERNMPSLKERPDITQMMRKAYLGDYNYFKNLYEQQKTQKAPLWKTFTKWLEGPAEFSEAQKQIMATDKEGNTVFHWAATSPNIYAQPWVLFWMVRYAFSLLPTEKEKLNFTYKENHSNQIAVNFLFPQLVRHPFNPEKDVVNDIYTLAFYSLYLAELNISQVFYDVLSWAIARRKYKAVQLLMSLPMGSDPRKPFYQPNQKNLAGKLPISYIGRDSKMRKLFIALEKNINNQEYMGKLHTKLLKEREALFKEAVEIH